jgi:3-deoxy-D-manno-octulosonic-acid transferase
MMRLLYSILVHLARPAALAVVLGRSLRNPDYRKGLPERFGFARQSPVSTIWLHAVSLGEVTAAVPIVRALHRRYPRIPVIVTVSTPTGRARAEALFGGSVAVRYLPYDTPGAMRRFLLRTRPRLAIVMETELWPNLFDQCRRQGVPIVLASARMSQKSVDRYLRFRSLFAAAFSTNTTIAAQTSADAARFIAVGAPPSQVQILGNVKFDLTVDAATMEQGLALRTAWGDRPVWIAGSTHQGEEDIVLAAHAELRRMLADALLVLVPRHPQRFAAVAGLLEANALPFERRSLTAAAGNSAVAPQTQVLLGDTVGELSLLYAAADLAFVGGSLVPVGGHNLLEPAALGLPVLTGPYQANGAQIAQQLIAAGAAIEVADAHGLADALRRLLAAPDAARRAGAAGRRVIDANRGSVARLLRLIEPLVEPAARRPAASPSAAR